MPATILDRPLLLTGMPGAGKTSVGRLLAERLRLPFVDTDQEVERSTGRTVAALWAESGEAAFRAAERRAVQVALESRAPRVIAVGGGALVEGDIRCLALSRAVVVWLQAPAPALAARLQGQPRPVLGGGDPVAGLARLAAERAAVYAEAQVHVSYAAGPPERTADAVLAALKAR